MKLLEEGEMRERASAASRQRRSWMVGRLMVALAACASVLAAGSPVQAVTGWTGPQTVVSSSSSPQGGSIAVYHGKAYVAYGRYSFDQGPVPNGVWVATNASGTWVRTKVVAGLYEAPSIALDDLGNIHLALQRDTKQCEPGGGMCQGLPAGISYATNRSGHWVVTPVSTGSHIGPTLKLFKGKAHIGFRSASSVFYATNATGTWVRTTVAAGSAIAATVDLAVTPTGTPQLVYATSELYHAVRTGTTFAKQQVRPGQVNFAQSGALSFPVGIPAIVFYSSGPMGSATGPAIHVVSQNGGVWSTPGLVDYADGAAYAAATGDAHVKAAYTAVGRGVSVVTIGEGTPSPVPLTTPNGQDTVYGMALTSAGKMRVLFSREGGLYYLGEN